MAGAADPADVVGATADPADAAGAGANPPDGTGPTAICNDSTSAVASTAEISGTGGRASVSFITAASNNLLKPATRHVVSRR